MPEKQLGIVLLLITTSGCAGRPWLTRAEPRLNTPASTVPAAHDQAAAATTAVPGFLPSRNASPGSASRGRTAASQQQPNQQQNNQQQNNQQQNNQQAANQQAASQQAASQQARLPQSSSGPLASQLLPGGESPRQQIPLRTPDGQLLAAVAALPNSFPTPYAPVYDHSAAGLSSQIQQYLDQKVEVAVRRQNAMAAPAAGVPNASAPAATSPDTANVQRDAAFNINDTDAATAEASATAQQETPPTDPNHGPTAAPAGEPGDVQLAAATSAADTAASSGNVVQALHTTTGIAKPAPGQWRDAATTAVDTLEKELATGTFNPGQRSRLNANARLLYAILNDSDQAVRPIDEFDEDEREYWKHLTYGLMTSLDADEKHTSSRRSALALRSIRRAADHLANISTLDVRNLAFCSKVESYGRFDEFKTYGFKPGQELLLYVEVENFAVESTGDRHETELQGEYTIFAADGQRVANAVLPLDKQVSKNRRHDYFIAYRVFVPKKIEQGHYTLQLTIEDVKGSKSNHASVEFWIR